MNDRASILIVSYNNFATTTGPCLASLMADPEMADFQIIVVDNHSEAATQQGLRELALVHPRLELIYNTDNRGFAGANNQAVARATGKYLILLNSDTVVPPGTISRLTQLLEDHPEWGMIGPVTNAAGNEQKIATRGTTPEDLLHEGAQWSLHARGSFIPSSRLDFFCVAITRQSWQQLGGLDESFGKGYYEDLDYCLRAKAAAIPMMVVEEVFIYHQGGGSFKKSSTAVEGLMRENRKKVLHKYPGQEIFRHSRLTNLAALHHYLQQVERGFSWEDLRFRFDNRLQLARMEQPRNPLKRFWYRRQVEQVARAFQQTGLGNKS